MIYYFLGLLGLTPNIQPKIDHLYERADHLRQHIIKMEEKLDNIDKLLTRIAERDCNK